MEQETNQSEEKNWKKYKIAIRFFGMLILGAIVIVSILRERIVNPPQNRVTVAGEGRVEYSPDQATITLGVQVFKAPTAQDALNQLNDKMKSVTSSIRSAGVDDKDIKTDTYSLSPQYDYADGTSTVSGYNANQNLEIKAKDIKKNSALVASIIQAASSQGVNRVLGVDFDTSDLESFKQEARVKAIEDAKKKADELFKSAGMREGKVVGWHENSVNIPWTYGRNYDAMGGSLTDSAKAVSVPEVPSGTQEVVVEVGVDYAAN
ncbi:MAG: SIMPL domain-containing protein [Candidatus Moranbacteria bacterium]|nr:SIMPL domain-containing protein [Candidatus Moranbacteria bacterium]